MSETVRVEPAADADLLRRLDDEAERARIAGFQHLEELLREARARIAQMALVEAYAAMGRRCETDNGTHCPEDVSCGEYITALTKRAEQAEAQLREAEAARAPLLALVAPQQQLAYWWNETGRCPCGARRENPLTHPHVLGCPTEAALRR